MLTASDDITSSGEAITNLKTIIEQAEESQKTSASPLGNAASTTEDGKRCSTPA